MNIVIVNIVIKELANGLQKKDLKIGNNRIKANITSPNKR